MTDRRRSGTARSAAGGLLRIIKRLSNQLMNTPRDCSWLRHAVSNMGQPGLWVSRFVLAYDWMETTDRPAWLRFVAILLFLWLGVTGLRR